MTDVKELVLEEDPDDPEDAVEYGRTADINPSNLENADQLGSNFGLKQKAEEDINSNPLFAKVDAGDGVQFMATKAWKGAIVAPTNAPKNIPEPPDANLVIDWAYGYRGYDSRMNVVYNAAGRIVYPIAGLVIVYDAKTHTQQHYQGHNDDVVSLAQSRANLNIIATGQVATVVNRRGTAPHICVWDSTDFKKQWILPNAHQRAVRALSFSADGKYLASVGDDDNFTVKVWDWERKTLLATAKGDANKIFQLEWNPKKPSEFVTVGKRHVFFWNFANNTLTKAKATMGPSYPWQTFYTVAFSDKGYACVGARDGSLYIFVDGEAKKVLKGLHKGGLLAIDGHAGGLVSSGADCKADVLDNKLGIKRSYTFPNKVKSVYVKGTNLLVGTEAGEIYEILDFQNASETQERKPLVKGHFDGELWGAAWLDNKTFLTAGEDNRIYMWDAEKHQAIAQTIINPKRGPSLKVRKASTMSTFPPNQCARALAVSPQGKEFIIGTNRGEVSVFSIPDMKLIVTHDLNQYSKRNVVNQVENWIQTIKYSPSGKTVAVGTHGMTVVLLDARDGYKPKGKLQAHNSFITQIDWSADGSHLQTNSGDYELLFHNVDENDLKSAHQNTSATALRDVKWATTTCILGWPVQGIFDPLQDGTDIHSVDQAVNKKLLVTADDYGHVNLFRYPVAQEGNQFKWYTGHSSHVVTVRFSPNENMVFSTGGNDRSVIQWRVV